MNAISFENVTKQYEISKSKKTLLHSLFGQTKKKKSSALSHISFSIKRGETIGIIGENGSGKSTILKLIAGILIPSKGTVKTHGKIASLLELGAGFHPDLTGRENILLSGLLLGFTKKEIEDKTQEIIDFADIGSYIDEHVRTYSSGMIVRLGFSIAIHAEPDILLIDEILSVGDDAFQRKSFTAIENLKKQKTTIVVVSHNQFLMTHFCQKCILIHSGKVITYTKPDIVYKKYHNILSKKKSVKKHVSHISKDISIKKVTVKNNKKDTFTIGSPVFIEIDFLTKTEREASFGIAIFSANSEHLYGYSTPQMQLKKGPGKMLCTIPKLPPVRDDVLCTIGIADMVRNIRYDETVTPLSIHITNKNSDFKGNIDFNCTFKHLT